MKVRTAMGLLSYSLVGSQLKKRMPIKKIFMKVSMTITPIFHLFRKEWRTYRLIMVKKVKRNDA